MPSLKAGGYMLWRSAPGGWKRSFSVAQRLPDDKAVTYFNKIYKAADVVKTAMKDMHKGKQVSIHGFLIRCQVLLVKLLPHSLVIKIWLKQQGH